MAGRKLFFAIIIALIITSLASAIRITEVELNPPGKDAGNEWIELYSEEEVNLNGYRLLNNDGDEILFNSGSVFSGYYVYGFSKQWLDNSDEKVFLYKGNSIIDETDLLEDSENSALTWRFCNEEWGFSEETKGRENECEKDAGTAKEEGREKRGTQKNEDENKKRSPLPEIREETKTSETKKYSLEKISSDSPEVIKLNTKSIKTRDSNEGLRKGRYGIYGLIAFCILLAVLFALKMKDKEFRKNGFE